MTPSAGTVPAYFLNASTLGLSLHLCAFAPLRSNNHAQFRWLTHTGSQVPPSGLNPSSRIFCKIHYRAGSLREIYYGDLQAPAPKKRLGCFRLTIWGSFRPCQRDVGRVELHKTAFLRHKPFCVSQMQRKSSSPSVRPIDSLTTARTRAS